MSNLVASPTRIRRTPTLQVMGRGLLLTNPNYIGHNSPRMATVLLDSADIKRTLSRMAHEILEANQGVEDLVVVGVMRRGWPIAKRLAFFMTQVEGTTVPCGKLDVSGFRDDRPRRLDNETEIPFQIEGKTVILVDEVIFTGRTIRAALDALIQHGRPARVQLGVLIDRGHRELPIQPDYCGKQVRTELRDRVIVKVNEIDGEDVVLLTALEEVAHAS